MGGPKRPTAGLKLAAWKSRRWQAEVDALRAILHRCHLDEIIRWRKPCYAHGGKNIAILQEMKHHLALMFFKGVLLQDPEGVLRRPGQNSRIGRRFEFTSVQQVLDSAATIERYVAEAIEIEEAGLTVEKPDRELVLPQELLTRFRSDKAFAAAFFALTPGRQRGYNIYFSAPKGAEARERRIEKYRRAILDGKGFHDR